MKKVLLCLVSLVIIGRLQSQTDFVCHPADDKLTPREHPVDITRMKVEVAFEPEKKLVKGTVTHTFIPLSDKVDSIFFDGPGIRIKSAKLNGASVVFTTNSNGVTIFPQPALQWTKAGKEHTLVFEYEANPKRGIYFIGWDQPENPANTNPWRIRRQIWTQGQGIDNRYWIPMYDDANDKFITETVVTFDKKYKVLSNGNKLKEKDNGNGTKTWQYAMTKPHAGYLLMLGIGEYEVKESKTSRGTPLYFWYYPDLKDWVEPTYRHTEGMFDLIEKETGIPYPWESYSEIMVQDFIYGAMENTTATIFGDFFFVDNRAYLDRNYVGVNCHELTHQWFGDYITHRSSSEMWLHESYATHYPKLFTLQEEGVAAYQWTLKSEMDRALEAGKKDSYPIRHSQAGSARIYPKGSAVISMLKDVVGKDQFNRALNYYLTNHAYKNVETNDLYQALQDVLGLAPSWFFEQWLYRGGEPHYKVKWEDLKLDDGMEQGTFKRFTRINVQQIHKQNEGTGLFKMPFDIEVYYQNGKHIRQNVWIEKETEVVDIPNANEDEVAFVVFDAGNKVLKNITFNRPYNELERQATNAVEPIDRYLALLELKDTDIEKKRALLHKIIDEAEFYGLRAEAAAQLANDTESPKHVIKALHDANVNVRKAVLGAMNHVPFELLEDVEGLLKDSSYVVIEMAFDKLGKDYPDLRERFLETTKDILGMNNALRIKWMETAGSLVMTARPEHWAQVAEFAGPGYEFRTRLNAFEAIKRLNLFNKNVFENLMDAAASQNGRLAGPAVATLEFFAKQMGPKANMVYFWKQNPKTGKQADIAKQLGITE
jgi:aminopeptidase N